MKILYNIDWLEVYCIEPSQGLTEEALKAQGYKVEIKPYGTRIYKQILDVSLMNGEHFCTICRLPASEKGKVKGGILPYGSCHIKIFNWILYTQNPVGCLVKFLNEFSICLKCLSRLDVCADMQTLADGTPPKAFVRGFLAGKYQKIGSRKFAEIGDMKTDLKHSIHGKFAAKMECQCLSFGSKKSNVYSKFYNKTQELAEVADKPYIRDQWRNVGFSSSTDVWRLEFSIGSAGRHVLDRESGETKELSLLDVATLPDIAFLFNSLARHYWQWRTVKKGQRKYLGEEKKFLPTTSKKEIADYRPMPVYRENISNKTDKMVVRYLIHLAKDSNTFSDSERLQLLVAVHVIVSGKRLYHDKTATMDLSPSSTTSTKNLKSLPADPFHLVGLNDIFNNY